MADTFLVLRSNATSPQLYFHDGQNIDPTGLGTLPGAALEDLTNVASNRALVKHNNRVVTLLNKIFVLQDSKIYVSTDEGATFTLDFTFTGTAGWEFENIGPVPVMVTGALKLVGFYMSGTDIFVFEYDAAAGTWSDADTGVNLVGSQNTGMTTPVVYGGLVYARIGDTFIAYDPVSSGTVTINSGSIAQFGSDQVIAWNGDLWLGPVTEGLVSMGMAKLEGSTWNLDTNGVDFGIAFNPSTTAKAGTFIDPNTGNLIVMARPTGSPFKVFRVTPGLVVTDITGTVVGSALTAITAVSVNTRIWPHITRSPGGNYSVTVYVAGGPDTSDAIERFTWVNDATPFTELGVVGGSGDMAFPYAIHGGDLNGFFAGEKRVMQTSQAANTTGITVTFAAYQQGGTTVSVRGHYDKVGADPNALTLDPMTLGNAAGDPGLAVTGANPGAQIDNVPADLTPISFDWDQVSDGFATGDNYNYQLEAL